MTDLTISYARGLRGGPTIQIGQGSHANGQEFDCISVDEEAFFLLHPYLQIAWPAWTPDHHYGIAEIPRTSWTVLCTLLNEAMTNPSVSPDEKRMFHELNEWITESLKAHAVLTVYGV